MYHYDRLLDESAPLTTRNGPVERNGDRDGLAAILDADCALAIWDRPLPPGIAGRVALLAPELIDDIDAIVDAGAVALETAILLGAAGYERMTALALAREIGAMADCLAPITSCAMRRIRLEIVQTDACRRFHADIVTMRMLATLHGPGTERIEAATPDAIERLPTGAVAIFKGRLLQDEPVVLHRSPPIAGTGLWRLVLVIDPA